MATVNWNQYIKAAEEAGESMDEFTPLPAGTYEVKVLEAKAVKTKNGSKDMFKVTFVVDGGPNAGRRLWANLVISPESPKAMAIVMRQLGALGARPLMEAGASNEQIAAGLKDALATIKVSVGEYQNKPKNEVDSIAGRQGGFNGPSSAAVGPVPSAATRSSLPSAPAGLPI